MKLVSQILLNTNESLLFWVISFIKWIFLKTGCTCTFHLLTVRFSTRLFKFQNNIIVEVSPSWLIEFKTGRLPKKILKYKKGRKIIKGNEIHENNFKFQFIWNVVWCLTVVVPYPQNINLKTNRPHII